MGLSINEAGQIDFKFDGDGEAAIKALSALATTTFVVGGAGVAVPAAGIAGAGIAAFAAADSLSDTGESTIIHHTAPLSVEATDENLDITYRGGFQSGSTTSFSGDTQFAYTQNNTATPQTFEAHNTNTTAVDPEVAKALANYHDMRGLMDKMGIKLDDDQEYGCAPSRTPRMNMNHSNASVMSR
jgi:phosphate-selective porin